MPSILFGDLPLVTSESELDAEKASHPDCDPYFIASGCIERRRELFEALWPAFEPYADPNFLQELRKHFHQRTWEMYLCNVLLQKGLPLVQQRAEGPDFFIRNDAKAYIECIAPTPGAANNPDTVPEPYSARLNESQRLQAVPEQQILLRITQAIKEKADKYDRKWRTKPWFDPDVPYIVAINTGDINYPGDPNMPYVLKALFGVSHMYIEFEPGTDYRSHGWRFRETIQRSSGNDVAVNWFTNPAVRHVSGVLFLDNTVLNHAGRECFIVNNLFADIPIPEAFFTCFSGWKARCEDGNIFVERTAAQENNT